MISRIQWYLCERYASTTGSILIGTSHSTERLCADLWASTVRWLTMRVPKVFHPIRHMSQTCNRYKSMIWTAAILRAYWDVYITIIIDASTKICTSIVLVKALTSRTQSFVYLWRGMDILTKKNSPKPIIQSQVPVITVYNHVCLARQKIYGRKMRTDCGLVFAINSLQPTQESRAWYGESLSFLE